MRTAARAIVIHDNHILLMHREKFGKIYDTLPGGNVRGNESPIDALNREMDEETQLQLANPKLVFIEHAGHPWGDQYHFLCDYVSGEPQLMPGGEEDLINKLGKNLHHPLWISLTEFSGRQFRTSELQSMIIDGLKNGWPEQPIEFNSKPA